MQTAMPNIGLTIDDTEDSMKEKEMTKELIKTQEKLPPLHGKGRGWPAEVSRYLFMVLGCISYAIGLCMFLIPHNIVGGGISGAASLIYMLTGLPAGLFIVLLNVPILLGGLKLMGWRFILRCFITTATLGLCTELCSVLPSITDNPLLGAVYGGLLQGLGIGLFIRFEMSSGGTELLGRITYHLIPVSGIATHVAIFDAAIVILGAWAMNNPENILYALILIFLSAKVSDMIVLGLNKAKMCYIITERADEIAAALLASSPRGVTRIHGDGMYTKSPRDVLMTCVKNSQVSFVHKTVKKIDPAAFMIVGEANEVYGKGFMHI